MKFKTLMLAACFLATSAAAQNFVNSSSYELGTIILKTMEAVKSPLSPVERQFTAQLLVEVADKTFEDMDSKKNWIYVLAIESKFDQDARSEVGATGIGQIMPAHAEEFGKKCGIRGVQASDVNNILINATLSACLFRHLLETVPDHSVVLALSAYNSGPSSSSTKNLQHFGSAGLETANYIAKFGYVKEQAAVKKSTQMDRK